MQADALVIVFEQMATKQDIDLLRTELKAEIAVLRSESEAGHDALRSEFRTRLSGVKADLT